MSTHQIKSTIMQSLRGITTLPTLAAYFGMMWRILHDGTDSQVSDRVLIQTMLNKESPGMTWLLRPSRGCPVVIGSLCTVPPGHYDSLCRGKGAGIWHWSQHSWTAARPAAGNIQHVQLRRLERGGSSLTPHRHTGSPALEARTEEEHWININKYLGIIIPLHYY